MLTNGPDGGTPSGAPNGADPSRKRGAIAAFVESVANIKPTLDALAKHTVRRPFGVGEYPADVMDFFHWGAFAEPTLWGIVYGVWQVMAVSIVATLIPLLVYLAIPEEAALQVSVQLGVLALSGVTVSVARIWIGMNASRLAWVREAQLVERALSGQPRRDIAWYVSRQWRWILWANVVLVITTAVAAANDYQALVGAGRAAALFAVFQHIGWPAAAYLGAWMVGGSSFAAIRHHLEWAPITPVVDADDVEPDAGREAETVGPRIVRSAQVTGLVAPSVPAVELPAGRPIPQVGFGTYKIPPGDDTFVATLEALRAGYRHIDTAALYANEGSVGEAIREFGLDRSEVFVTTKVWNDQQGYAATLDAFDESLNELGLDFVDLYLVHWPIETTMETTWFALEHLFTAGRARAIGVCNFDVEHLEQLRSFSRVAPMVNQFELHPRFQRNELVEYCRSHQIAIEAWAPLMRGGVFGIPELVGIGEPYGKSAGQVALRWAVQSGYVVLPKSVHPGRIAENLDVFDFELSPQEMRVIGSLDRGERVGPDPDRFSWRWPESER